MATKSCPSCAAEVPADAPRCKHCFHDFTEKPVSRKASGLVGLLVLLAVMAVMAAGTMFYVQKQTGSAEKVVIDQETSSVIFTRRYSDHTETDRLTFDDIAKVEVVLGGKQATFEVALVTLSGDRRVIKLSDDKSLKSYAEHVAHVMDKPLVEEREIKTFGD